METEGGSGSALPQPVAPRLQPVQVLWEIGRTAASTPYPLQCTVSGLSGWLHVDTETEASHDGHGGGDSTGAHCTPADGGGLGGSRMGEEGRGRDDGGWSRTTVRDPGRPAGDQPLAKYRRDENKGKGQSQASWSGWPKQKPGEGPLAKDPGKDSFRAARPGWTHQRRSWSSVWRSS